jgi:membrane fusion protein (multidrug efflux system)
VTTLLIVLAVALAIATHRYLGTRNQVSTDDAQVEGHMVPVLARVGGYVAAVQVTDNQPVHAGDLLVLVDDRDLRARLAQAEADVAAAEAAAGSPNHPGQAAAQLAAARAAVAQAGANARRAQSDVERYRTLAAQNIISRQQLDAAEAMATSTQAQLAAAQEQVVAASAAVQGASQRLASARASRDQVALQLSYARITAPVDGVSSRKAVEVGQLVQPGQQVLVVVPLSDVWVVANLKETQLSHVDPGDRAEVVADTYAGRKYPGRVESLSPATGAKFSLLPPDNATGNFTKVVQRVPVKIRLTGALDAARPLRPGMSVRVTIWRRDR